jgi:hypothetical protein
LHRDHPIYWRLITTGAQVETPAPTITRVVVGVVLIS